MNFGLKPASLAAGDAEMKREGVALSAMLGLDGEKPPWPKRLKRLLQYRSERRRSDPDEFLEWPAWDVLLDLTLTEMEGHRCAVSALCFSSGASQSTCLRKLAQLEAAGLLRRNQESGDKRRILVELTDLGRKLVREKLATEISFYKSFLLDQ